MLSVEPFQGTPVPPPNSYTRLYLWQELLQGLNLGGRKAAVPSLAVVLSLEGKASHRELTSRLLSDLVGKVLSPEDIATAFDGMLHDLPDLILDTPEAPQVRGGARSLGVGILGGSCSLNFVCLCRCWASSLPGLWPTTRCHLISSSATRGVWTVNMRGE